MKTGSLFSGYGGLEIAVNQFFGAQTAWVSDIDPGACKILAHHWPDVPNLGDITAIDWSQVEPVGILCAGWPCQPFSLAGKRKGAADERALWPFVAGAVRALRPRHVVLENVAAIATAGELSRACAELASLGFVGSWRCLRAADVGAPHGRARIFISAHATGQPGSIGHGDDVRAGWGTDGRGPASGGSVARDTHVTGLEGRQSGGWGRGQRPTRASGLGPVADPTRNGRDEGRPKPAGIVGGSDAAQRGHAPTDANGHGQQSVGRLESVRRDPDRRDSTHVAWGAYEPAIRRWELVLGRPAPAPTEASPRGAQRLSPKFVEFMMGLPAGHVTDVPGLSRNAQLKALGNGVVPQQAYAALQLMAGLAVAS